MNRRRGPADQRSVRRHNLGLVLRDIAETPRSRARIAASTGLNKTTVSSLVAELVERDLVRESQTERPGAVGRPALMLELHGEGLVALGLEVNVDHLGVSAVDLLGRVRYEVVVGHVGRGSAPGRTLARLARLVEEALAELEGHGLTTIGAAVALPGLVDIHRGMLFVAPNLGWTETPVAALLQAQLGDPSFPIRVDNEANLGALAERWEGVGRGLQDFVYVSGDAGVGVGAGVVLGGQLYRGASGFGGEFGHVVLEPRGERCACGGRGCLEGLVGQEALLRLVGWDPELVGAEAGPPGMLPARLAERARAGDERTLAALAQVGTLLGIGLATVTNVLNTSAVVLGGYFQPLVEWLAGPVEHELATRVLSARWSPVTVVASALGSDATVRGAAALALREVLDDPAAAPLRARRVAT